MFHFYYFLMKLGYIKKYVCVSKQFIHHIIDSYIIVEKLMGLNLSGN